jgi:hypothetical protein
MSVIKLFLALNNYALRVFFQIRNVRFQDILKFKKYSQKGKNNFISDIPGFPAGDREPSLSFFNSVSSWIFSAKEGSTRC